MGKFCDQITESHFTQQLAERLAIVTLKRQARGKLKICRDNVDYVIYQIIKGYTKYDASRGTTLRNYLVSRAKFAVKSLFTMKQKKKNVRFVSLDKDLTTGDFTLKDLVTGSNSHAEGIALYNEIISYIETTPDLPERQRKVLLMHYRDGMSLDDICSELEVLHRTYIYVLLDGGLQKVKEKFNGE